MVVPKNIPKITYRKILYTTDLSESGRHAFHHAAALSKCFGSGLTVFHAIEGGPELDRRLFGYVDEELWEEIKTRNLEEARDILTRRRRDDAAIRNCVGKYCDEVQANVPEHAEVTYEIKVRMGNAVDCILEEAQTGGFDLIVMGSHGHAGLRHAIMGNTVKQVVGRSAIPVLVVRVPEEEEKT